MTDTEDELNTVPVEDPPTHYLGNLLWEGPDGRCAHYYSGIDERCSNDADAHTFVEHGDEWVCIEMCAEHAREDIPEFSEWKQEVLADAE